MVKLLRSTSTVYEIIEYLVIVPGKGNLTRRGHRLRAMRIDQEKSEADRAGVGQIYIPVYIYIYSYIYNTVYIYIYIFTPQGVKHSL